MNISPKLIAMVGRAVARQQWPVSPEEELAYLIASQATDNRDNYCSACSLPANELTWRERRDYY